MKNKTFSVSMCVYIKDNPVWFREALASVIFQTIKPYEIVLVIDGPISMDLEAVVEDCGNIATKENIIFKVIRFEHNKGHGEARRQGVNNCSQELVAIMDSDDIATNNRFETQLSLFESNIDICGGDIAEFIGDQCNVVSKRKVPIDDFTIKKYAKKRCPMNQMTVMFKKSTYNLAGGYLDWFQDEDYYLWLRMIKCGAIFANSGTTLVNVRIGEDMFRRRGGLRYYRSEKKLQKYMLREKVISYPRYKINCLKRFIVQVLLPNKIRGWVFRKFAR